MFFPFNIHYTYLFLYRTRQLDQVKNENISLITQLKASETRLLELAETLDPEGNISVGDLFDQNNDHKGGKKYSGGGISVMSEEEGDSHTYTSSFSHEHKGESPGRKGSRGAVNMPTGGIARDRKERGRGMNSSSGSSVSTNVSNGILSSYF